MNKINEVIKTTAKNLYVIGVIFPLALILAIGDRAGDLGVLVVNSYR